MAQNPCSCVSRRVAARSVAAGAGVSTEVMRVLCPAGISTTNESSCWQPSPFAIMLAVELRHLVYFVTVAEERNFTRAAQRLRVVQSGASAAIRALDRELGTRLFERSSQRVVLTDAGAALLPAGHPLAERPGVTLADLADEPFVDSPLGYGNRTEVDRGFAAAGLRRRVALEVADIATVQHYVRNGLGVALIPPFSVASGDGL